MTSVLAGALVDEAVSCSVLDAVVLLAVTVASVEDDRTVVAEVVVLDTTALLFPS